MTKKRKIKIGDHLVVDRKIYTHHGIYVGEGKVIHYSGSPNNLKNAIVEQTTIEDFAKMEIAGKSFTFDLVIKDESYKKFSREEVVKRAKKRIGEKEYNLVTNNCETFCNWCISGQNVSNQVIDTVESIESIFSFAIESITKIRDSN